MTSAPCSRPSPTEPAAGPPTEPLRADDGLQRFELVFPPGACPSEGVAWVELVWTEQPIAGLLASAAAPVAGPHVADTPGN